MDLEVPDDRTIQSVQATRKKLQSVCDDALDQAEADGLDQYQVVCAALSFELALLIVDGEFSAKDAAEVLRVHIKEIRHWAKELKEAKKAVIQ